MFSALVVENTPDTAKRKIRDRLFSAHVSSCYFNVKGGAPFKVIRAFRYRGVIPWYSIAAVKSGRMLLPRGAIPPRDAGIKLFVPRVLPARMLANSAFVALKSMKLPERDICLTLFDDDGTLCDIASRLVLAARYLRIITPNVQKYEPLRRRVFESHGISLVVTQDENEQEIMASTVVISPKSRTFFCKYKGIIFTNSVCTSTLATVMRGRGVALSEDDAALVPEGIDTLDFAAALYESCGVSRLEDETFEHIDVTVR